MQLLSYCLLLVRAVCGVRRRRLLSQRPAECRWRQCAVWQSYEFPLGRGKGQFLQGQICQMTRASGPRQAAMQRRSLNETNADGWTRPGCFPAFCAGSSSGVTGAASPRRSPRRTDERPHLGSPATPRHRCGRRWTASRGRPRYTTTFSRGQSVPVQAAVTRRRTCSRGRPTPSRRREHLATRGSRAGAATASWRRASRRASLF